MKAMHDYQIKTSNFIVDTPRCGIFLNMGYGKTRATLDALQYLPKPILIVAPKRVAQTVWYNESQKWGYNFIFSEMLGSPSQRTFAMNANADIYVVNVENLNWLRGHFKKDHPYKTIVFDESSLYKTPSSKRSMAALWMAKRAERVIELTGTPAPNGLYDLYFQLKILDGGERLGRSVERFRKTWCYPENPFFEHTRWKVIPEREEQFHEKIADICMSLDEEDTLDLPDKIVNDILVSMNAGCQRDYDELRDEMFVITKHQTIEPQSAGALVGKLTQFASGAVYTDDRLLNYQIEHDAKFAALDDIVEEASGQPILVWYGFRHSMERIYMRYPHLNIGSSDDIEAWNQGLLDMLVMHPASGGHGLNLQGGGHIMCWFDMTYNLEHYQQACARLHRQGQTEPVVIHRILTDETIDQGIAEALESKADVQSILMKEISR